MERQPPAGQGFPKASRLRRRPEFTRVFDNAVRIQSRLFTVLFAPGAAGRPRLGIVASRKLGDAVRRNRAKRLIREVFRLAQPLAGAQGVDIVVIPRRELFAADYPAIEGDLRQAFKRGLSRLPPRAADGR